MAGDAGNRLEITHQDTAFYIKTLVLPRWLTLSFCPENIKKNDRKTSENHEKTILGALGDTPGRVSGSHLGPKDEKTSKKHQKGSPLGPPLGSIGGQFFIILAENLIFWCFFSRRFSELIFLWILGGSWLQKGYQNRGKSCPREVTFQGKWGTAKKVRFLLQF